MDGKNSWILSFIENETDSKGVEYVRGVSSAAHIKIVIWKACLSLFKQSA